MRPCARGVSVLPQEYVGIREPMSRPRRDSVVFAELRPTTVVFAELRPTTVVFAALRPTRVVFAKLRPTMVVFAGLHPTKSVEYRPSGYAPSSRLAGWAPFDMAQDRPGPPRCVNLFPGQNTR